MAAWWSEVPHMTLRNDTAGIEKVKHQSRRERKQSVLTPTEMLSSFVSHKHGPCLLLSLSPPLYSTHMFLFKASSADYHDWCVLSPLPTRRPTTVSHRQRRGGLSLQPHCWFSTGKLHHSSTHSLLSLSLQPLSAPLSSFSSASFCLDCKVCLRSWIPFRCKMQLIKSFSFHTLLLFWFLPMLLSALLWAGGRLSYMARCLGVCSQVASLRCDQFGRQGAGVGSWRHTGCTAAAA